MILEGKELRPCFVAAGVPHVVWKLLSLPGTSKLVFSALYTRLLAIRRGFSVEKLLLKRYLSLWRTGSSLCSRIVNDRNLLKERLERYVFFDFGERFFSHPGLLILRIPLAWVSSSSN